MFELEAPFRKARPDDAPVMARLVNMAGEGMPFYLWERMAEPGQTAWDVGTARAVRDEGSFSWRNTFLCEDLGRPVAGLMGYPLEDNPPPTNYKDMPPMFVPLQELEDMAPGTWYINVIASLPDQRGKGFGSSLMRLAEHLALDAGKSGLSLIVSNTNTGAMRLYRRCGFDEIARRPMVREVWDNPGTEWVLMIKDLSAID